MSGIVEKLPFENQKSIEKFLENKNISNVPVDYLTFQLKSRVKQSKSRDSFIQSLEKKIKTDFVGKNLLLNTLKDFIVFDIEEDEKEPRTYRGEFTRILLENVKEIKSVSETITEVLIQWDKFSSLVQKLVTFISDLYPKNKKYSFEFPSVAKFMLGYAKKSDRKVDYYVSKWKKYGFVLQEFKSTIFGKDKLPSILLNAKMKSVISFVKGQLKKINMLELGYLQMKYLSSKITSDWYKTRVPHGKAVGTIAAQSIGERATQQSMKTVHTAGISLGKASITGISRVEEILEVKQCPSKPSMKFFVKNKNISSLEAKVIANQFKFTIMQDLVLSVKKDKYDAKNKPEWYTIQDLIFDKRRVREDVDMHRLVFILNTKECFMRRITMYDIMKKIHLDDTVMGSDMTFYFSGKNIGEFHILVTDTFLEEFKGQDQLESLKNKVLNVPISGIQGVTNVFASCYNLDTMITGWSDSLSPIFNEKELNRTMVSKNVVLEYISDRTGSTFDGKSFKWKGDKNSFVSELKRDHVILSNACRVEDAGLYYIVHFTNELDSSDVFYAIPAESQPNTKTSVKVLKTLITLDDLNNTIIPVKRRVDSNKYWYWETDGSNLSSMYEFNGLFPRDNGKTETIDIVYQNLTSNHIVDVQNILGVEAAKRLIIDEMIASTSDVQIGHIRELADMMTLEGFMVQVTRHSFNKLDNDFLSKISFEENTKQYHISAAMGMKDNIQNIDSAIITGNLVPVGVVKSEDYKKEDQKAERIMNMMNSSKPKIVKKKPPMQVKIQETAPKQDGAFIDV